MKREVIYKIYAKTEYCTSENQKQYMNVIFNNNSIDSDNWCWIRLKNKNNGQQWNCT